MAYQQTTASSVEDLINKLATFAAGLGWTIHRNTLVTTNRTLSIRRSGDYIHIYNSDTTNVRIRASTGIDTGVAVSSQPGVSTQEAVMNCQAGPFTNVFFFGANTPSEHIYTVVDGGSVGLRHMAIGELTKIGAYTGGTFFDAMNISTSSFYNATVSSSYHHVMFDSATSSNNGLRGAVRIDADGLTSNYAPMTAATDTTNKVTNGGMRASRTEEGFYNSSVNSWSGVTPLQPIKVRFERDSDFFSEIGIVPNLRFVNMSRWAPGDEFTIGADTWKVFPWWRQGTRPSGDTTTSYSNQYAFAYLKVL